MNIGVTLLRGPLDRLVRLLRGGLMAIPGDPKVITGDAHPGIGILLAAIVGTVAYDVGGLFIGKQRRAPAPSAASPNKTQEGLGGGMVISFILVVFLSAAIGFGPIDGLTEGSSSASWSPSPPRSATCASRS